MGAIAEERILKVIHRLQNKINQLKRLLAKSSLFVNVYRGIDKPCNKVYNKIITINKLTKELMTKTNDTLTNAKCIIHLNLAERSDINGRDLTDQYNDPAFYTKTVRGLKKAWEKLSAEFTEETGMYDAIRIINEAGVRTHSYCMVD